MKRIDWTSDASSDTGWKTRHRTAIQAPQGFEKPIVGMLRGWLDYATRHEATYESTIGDDGVLGPAWARLGSALHELLNGDCGRLDCGTISTIINDNLRETGFDPEEI